MIPEPEATMYERIIVPLDGTLFGAAAVPLAVAVASRSGAAIELVHVHIPEPDDEALYSFTAYRYEGAAQLYHRLDRAALRREVEAYRERAGTLAADTGLSITSRVVTGHIERALEEEAESFDADLIVMGTHARTGFARVKFGSVAESIVRLATMPVLLVRPDTVVASDAAWTINNVLVPLDGSAFSEQVLPSASRLAAIFEAGLGVVHVDTSLRDVFDAPETEANSGAEYLETHVASSEYVPEDTRLLLVESRHPADAIIYAAEQLESDLIAMATHGRGGLSRLLVGSTANEVLRRTRLPVLLHRPSHHAVRTAAATMAEPAFA